MLATLKRSQSDPRQPSAHPDELVERLVEAISSRCDLEWRVVQTADADNWANPRRGIVRIAAGRFPQALSAFGGDAARER
jgi:hypothetical protein